MQPWHAEVVELHEFFEQYFAGALPGDAIGRLESALAPEFTIVSPAGVESSRAETIAAITSAHGSRDDLRMSIESPRLLVDGAASILARYVEVHHTGDGERRRVSTVAFRRDVDGPNGVRWQSVHETWLPD